MAANRVLIFGVAGLLLVSAAAFGQMMPVRLRCEYLRDPLGIDVQPRLTWAIEASGRGRVQTAYQVLVASSPRTLAADHGDLWDSGKVKSGESVNIDYEGKPLASGSAAYWKVRVWDGKGVLGPFSEPACWEMGLLHPADWHGRWIASPQPLPATQPAFYDEMPAPMFRREFAVSKPVRRARAYVSGLGYYLLGMNGRRVGDRELDPAWTSYARRVCYSTYDVTDLLREGPNAIGIVVGNGWFNPLPMRMWGWLNLRQHLFVGRPRAILQLNIEYADGTFESVFTDESWRVFIDGPLRKNNLYLGEIYDARKEIEAWTLPGFDDSTWLPAARPPGEVGPLRAQMLPPITVGRSIRPVRVTEPSPGVYIFDMGQNFSGWAKLRIEAERGTRVRMRFGELLHPDGTLNPMTSVAGQIKEPGVGGEGAPDVAWQADEYICKGGGLETYTPRFTWHGFRYVELTGVPSRPPVGAIEGLQLHSAVEPAGAFSCSNDMLNAVQNATRMTMLSNMFSVQSDCPHRERFGYGGDIVATSDMAMLNLDMAAFYAKTVTDFADAVRPNGGLTETAPFVGIDGFKDGLGGGAGPIGWGTVHPLLLWQMHQYYGDKRLMAEQYDVARRWLAFLDSQAADFFIERGIGDHESLDPKVTPLTSTAFYHMNADLFSRIARALGRNADADRYAGRAAAIKAAFNRRFFDAATGRYDAGTQACQAFPLFLGLVPGGAEGKVLRVLLDDIAEHGDHLTTGIFGTKYMLMALSSHGRADVAYRIANQRDFPGWGHMLERGATTLWEHWEFSDNIYSHNHPMFGSISEWFIRVLGGIAPAEDAVGFDRIVIRPAIVPGLQWVRARHDSLRGPIVCEWSIEGPALALTVSIPPNTKAMLHLPSQDLRSIREGVRQIQQADGLSLRRVEVDRSVFEAGSGTYRLTMPWPPPPPRPPIPTGLRN